jgi:two-component system response regulator AtoC
LSAPPTATWTSWWRPGAFAADLLYRLRVFQINIPPLRARGEDVLLLARRFLAQMAQRYGKAPPDAGRLGLRRTCAHITWPGNVRELRNVIERAVLLNQGRCTARRADLALGPRPALRRPRAAAAPGANQWRIARSR